jgi:hypothetical protein
MSDNARDEHRDTASSSAAAHAAVAIVTACMALLVAACGASSGGHVAQLGSSASGPASSSSATGSPNAQMLAFSRCMRSNGVSNFPDPDRNGELPKNQVAQLSAGSPQFVPARRACGHLLPNGGEPTAAQVRQAWDDMRAFAGCMRSHGVASWPDPTATSQHDQRPFFRTEEAGIDPNAPQVAAAMGACQHVLDTSNPLVTTQ